jgi:hypothetical protein
MMREENLRLKSLISLLFCLPIGLLAFYSSYKYLEYKQNGELELAEKYKNRVKILFPLSIIFAVIVLVYSLVKIVVL